MSNSYSQRPKNLLYSSKFRDGQFLLDKHKMATVFIKLLKLVDSMKWNILKRDPDIIFVFYCILLKFVVALYYCCMEVNKKKWINSIRSKHVDSNNCDFKINSALFCFITRWIYRYLQFSIHRALHKSIFQ